MTTTQDRPAAQAPTLLNKIIAVRGQVKNDTAESLTKKYRLLGNAALLTGHSRTYQPHNEDDFRYPSEHVNPRVSAETMLREIGEEMTRLFDVTAAMDWSNQHARADVVLLSGSEPVTLLKDVPVTYLMFLEKSLVNIETVIRNLPTLDPTERWEYDASIDGYRSAPVGTVKTKKVRRNHVLAPATDRHPAQVESYTEDEPIGVWSTTKFSGALPAKRVNNLLNRVTALLTAVKFAREQANLEEVMDPRPGKIVFQYLFAPDPA